MTPAPCPYLGLKDDPDTALQYPAPGNHCYHARPVAPVEMDHQRGYCLSAQHTACPVYTRAILAPLPRGVRAESAVKRLRGGYRVWAAGLGALVLVLSLFWLSGLLGSRAVGGGIPVTGGGGAARTPFQPGLIFTRTPAATAGLLYAFSPSPNPTRVDCPLPAGWEGYVVNPTDSLVRLSVLYNVPLDDLLAVNCMLADAVLHPGELIYVPVLATLTASPSPTATVNPTRPLVVIPTATSKPSSPENPRPSSTTAPTRTRSPSMTPVPPTVTSSPTQSATPTLPSLPTEPPPNPTVPIPPTDTSPPPTEEPTIAPTIEPTPDNDTPTAPASTLDLEEDEGDD